MSNNLSQATNGLLMQLVMDLKSGYLRRCEALGLSREEMQMLQGLSIEEIHYLSNSEVSVLRLDINHNNLVRMLQQARTEQKRLVANRSRSGAGWVYRTHGVLFWSFQRGCGCAASYLRY